DSTADDDDSTADDDDSTADDDDSTADDDDSTAIVDDPDVPDCGCSSSIGDGEAGAFIAFLPLVLLGRRRRSPQDA
ncbi:MAG: hypothetical protein KDA24_20405, partial [Deltaproteobacteria bacterium]|nr:hypothetical protein [Deltaproteobacteria bacterium]